MHGTPRTPAALAVVKRNSLNNLKPPLFYALIRLAGIQKDSWVGSSWVPQRYGRRSGKEAHEEGQRQFDEWVTSVVQESEEGGAQGREAAEDAWEISQQGSLRLRGA